MISLLLYYWRREKDRTGGRVITPAPRQVKDGLMIGVVIPCFRARQSILTVLADIPDMVDRIYCVDDGCPDETGRFIEQSAHDQRIAVLFNPANLGVGGAVMTGYRAAIVDGMDIVVKVDADGQMDPALIPRFVEPIAEGLADYTKGNRFYHPDWLEGMPLIRLCGNAVLSILTKFSTGYWQLFDPTNGFTAIHTSVLKLLPLDKISRGYFFESDMLFRLNTIKAVVLDVPQKAVYGNEESHMKIWKILPQFALFLSRNFLKRIFYNYYLRDFHLASLEWVLGPLMLLFSIVFGSYQWRAAIVSGEAATAGTVMLAALPMIVGLQLVLSALNFDIHNQPTIPVHKFFRDGTDKRP